MGLTLREIGRRLGRDHTSLSDELRNNAPYGVEYIPCRAQRLSDKRGWKQRCHAPLKNPLVFLYVREHLRLGWSPDEISGRLKLDHPEFALPTMINPAYSEVTEEILTRLEELTNVRIHKKLARQGNFIQSVYNIVQARNLLYRLPRVDPNRYFIDEHGVSRISPQGLVFLFSRRFPKLSLQVVKDQLEKIESQLDWIPASYQSTPERAKHRHFAVIKMYSANQQTIDSLNQALIEHFTAY